eukprot:m.355688 g.355688  ORF g.355688 m.355688 type:complete len:451 (-) comp17308_c0_seq1:1664-3016(-)
MSSWLCREPLKATSDINFARGRGVKAATTEAAREQFRLLTQARAELIARLAQFEHSASDTDEAFNEYISLLTGFIAVAESYQAPPTPEEDSEMSEEERKKLEKSRAVYKLLKKDGNPALSFVTFKFKDNVQEKVVEHASFDFELANMIMNYGLWHMKHAAYLEDFSAPEEERMDVAKSIMDSMKMATGVFNYLLENHLRAMEYKPNTDFDERILRARANQCFAEALEGIVERARTLGHQPSLISKIAYDLHVRFRDAADELRSMSTPLGRRLHKYMSFKATFYQGYYLTYQGMDLQQTQKSGDAIRCFEDAQRALASARELAQRYADASKAYASAASSGIPPTDHPVFGILSKLIHKTKAKAEQENTILHFQKIPATPPTEPVRECPIQPGVFQLPEPSSAWTAVKLDFSKIPFRGQDAAADKDARDTSPVKPTPFDPVRSRGNNTCVIS